MGQTLIAASNIFYLGFFFWVNTPTSKRSVPFITFLALPGIYLLIYDYSLVLMHRGV
jgi:hypothetical protein